MSVFITHKLLALHTIPRSYSDKTGRMVKEDSEDEIRRSVWRLTGQGFAVRRRGAVSLSVSRFGYFLLAHYSWVIKVFTNQLEPCNEGIHHRWMLLIFNFPATHSFFMVNLHGPIVALLTPFDASGEIECQAFKTYLSSLYSWGVRTVIANGTTGEFPSLTTNERQQVIEFVRENFDGTIVNNVSATCVRDVRNLIAGTQGYADFLLLKFRSSISSI